MNEKITTTTAALSNKIETKPKNINENCAKHETTASTIIWLKETIFSAIEIVKVIIAFVLYRLNEFVMLIRMTGDLYKNNTNNKTIKISMNNNSYHSKKK